MRIESEKQEAESTLCEDLRKEITRILEKAKPEELKTVLQFIQPLRRKYQTTEN